MKKISTKKILFTIFIVIGSIIILFSGFVFYLLFFSRTISTEELTRDFDDYMFLYNDDMSLRNIPDGITIESTELIVDDGYFDYSITFKNVSDESNSLFFQVYASEAYMDVYDTNEAFIEKNELLYLEPDETLTVNHKGIIIGEDEDIYTLLDYVYVELFYGDYSAKLLVPTQSK